MSKSTKKFSGKFAKEDVAELTASIMAALYLNDDLNEMRKDDEKAVTNTVKGFFKNHGV